jgi:hypothetical protein
MFSAQRAKFHAVQHFFATLLGGAVAWPLAARGRTLLEL